MKLMKQLPVFLVLAIAGLHPSARADVNDQDVQKRVQYAVAALDELMLVPETSIPEDLLHAATYVANIHLTKAGFIFGAEVGRGVASCRNEAGAWSAPIFTQLVGGTWGLQIGVAVIDLTLVFTNHSAREGLAQGNFKLSGNAGLAVGPTGRDSSAGTNYTLKDRTYSYSRSKGLFAGLTVEGAAIIPDKAYNSYVYGNLNTRGILTLSNEGIPGLVTPYANALAKYAR